MNTSKSYRDLEVWRLSMQLVERTYYHTAHFPSNEIYGLTSQLKRSCISISANIAEGKGRQSKGEFRQFLNIARGSAAETMSHLETALMLGFLNKENYETLFEIADRISAMLYKLIITLR